MNGGPGYATPVTYFQSLKYDGVKRLVAASDSGSWSRTFGYDAYGNMTPSGTPNPPAISFNSNNQINPDIALGTMIGDPDRDRVVLGKSKEELEKDLVSLQRLTKLPSTTGLHIAAYGWTIPGIK